MKVLVFSIGAERYGLALGAIARVLPAAQLRQLPLAPAFVAGLMDLHGAPVPVIDLSRLAGFTPKQVWFDTRIVLVDYMHDDGVRPLGLMAEHVLGIETIDGAALADSGVAAAPFLGRVAATGAGMLQLVELDQLLPPAVRALLFQTAAAP
ncbi:MAG: chemotaxis protein [Massilia sp.]|jgi:chemotaxis-related protein WspB|nr:chemotaxis protein [Massilia sp.]